MTKISFNRDLLNEILNRDNAVLVGEYTQYNRENIYTFRCKCGTSATKTGRRIVSNGATCKACTLKIGLAKGQLSRNNKITEEQRVAKAEAENAVITKQIYEDNLRNWRDNIVKKVTPEPNKWYVHPLHKIYEANINGDLRNINRANILISGSTDKLGRTTISIKGAKKQKHRIIMECIYNVEIPLDYDIDHIDKNPGNNLFSNLKILTRAEHCLKTAKTNPDRSKKATAKSSKSIVCRKLNESGNVIETSIFNSIRDASNALKITRRPIQRSLQTSLKTKSGYIFEEILVDTDVLENESWLEYNNSDLFVSDKGRVKFGYLSKQYITRGSQSTDGYYTVSHKGKAFKVHNLVAILFIGNPPTSEHSVDHVDNNRANNNLENLRWATRTEQATNRSNVKPIEVYNYKTGEVIDTFDTQKACAEKYRVRQSQVSESLRFGLEQFDRGKQLGPHKYISVRYRDLSNTKKLQKDIAILDHDLNILPIDKNKRSEKSKHLPIHITQSGMTYVLNITFRDEKIRKCSNNIAALEKIKEEWVTLQKQQYIDLYIKLYS